MEEARTFSYLHRTKQTYESISLILGQTKFLYESTNEELHNSPYTTKLYAVANKRIDNLQPLTKRYFTDLYRDN